MKKRTAQFDNLFPPATKTSPVSAPEANVHDGQGEEGKERVFSKIKLSDAFPKMKLSKKVQLVRKFCRLHRKLGQFGIDLLFSKDSQYLAHELWYVIDRWEDTAEKEDKFTKGDYRYFLGEFQTTEPPNVSSHQ